MASTQLGTPSCCFSHLAVLRRHIRQYIQKWNKHNSFLFTAAGLPRQYVHRESNIHFLSTSNIAPPLEMLDGIVDQLQCVL
ncbi:hypothetical protein B0H10DRAFT_1843918 [Mycena sp. CBHHK59/15]|nr:hypothetical protein B0H10DRAFT_1843918 [Mycena sp. CBHHK59/15]